MSALGYDAICSPTCSTRSRPARAPVETFYDGYVVNAIMDAAYRADRLEAVGAGRARSLARPRGRPHVAAVRDFDAEHTLLKQEPMPDGTVKLLLRHKASGRIVERRRE